MELLSFTSSTSSRISSGVPLFSPNFPTKAWSNQNPLKYQIPSSKFYTYTSFSRNSCFTRRRNFRIFADFVRPTSRRNSLRKKLVEEQQQVRQNSNSSNPGSNFQYPDSKFNKIDSSEELDGVGSGDDIVEHGNVENLKPKHLDKSVLWDKLENWVDQYKKDIEFWGIGSGHVFTVFPDSNGNVKWVSVDEDEILRRSRVEHQESEDLTDVNSKISLGRSLARDMENGENVIPRNSSIAKFVVQGSESGFSTTIRSLVPQPELSAKLSRVGGMVLCSFVMFWALKKLFSFRFKEVQYSELEKEMMRRKIKLRKEKEMLKDGSVEVVEVRPELPVVSFEKPKLDKQELLKSIKKAKVSISKLALDESLTTLTSKSVHSENEIQEVGDIDVEELEIEARQLFSVDSDSKEQKVVDEKFSREFSSSQKQREEDAHDSNNTLKNIGLLNSSDSVEKSHLENSSSSSTDVSYNSYSITLDVKDSEGNLRSADTKQSYTDGESREIKKTSMRSKLRVIKSVKEAREYLSKKRDKHEQIPLKTVEESAAAIELPTNNGLGSHIGKEVALDCKMTEPLISVGSDSSPSIIKEEPLLIENDRHNDSVKDNYTVASTEARPSVKSESWLEENFNEVEPVVKKIGVGFRDNYTVAREKESQQLNTSSSLTQLQSNDDNDDELEWMRDNNLREIVFQVRDNELAGRDPFYSMDEEDRLAFFKGLEKKVERENEKLLKLHEYLHSNIENLDYGADGISLYDPPEKVIPRWKGPPLEKSSEFFEEFLEQRKSIFASKDEISASFNKSEQNLPSKSTNANPDEEKISTSLETHDTKITAHDRYTKNSKTIIEGSDGSVRVGKKSGKEFWQHTKKWSRGFLESYNEATDPEVKSAMKDMGKDLDRWITEEEIKEAGDLINKIPERNKKFMEKKLNKLKREMELFGPQAVVSKYREYAEEKEEDYLWWLDLPHVLCIELYTENNGEQRIGLYSLEMAEDLELEPKPCHVIAFEDVSDCKNLCYIIQSHMEMLGNGHAFVVARPPKDAFREAKENGFSVTVIRKGELELNVDQALQEVEEKITEIGSKMYHDMIMSDRSVDISTLMKGVFGFKGRPTKRKSPKRKLKRPRKN